MSIGENLIRLRYRLIPDQIIGELLSKSWIDTCIPASLLAVTVVVFAAIAPDFLSLDNLSDTGRQLGELGFIAIGLTVVLMAGGIDLSVGSIYGLCNFATLEAFQGLGLPLWLTFLISLGLGGLVGTINGLLIGYLRLRAFLTTLVTLIIVRAIVQTAALTFGEAMTGVAPDRSAWDFVGDGTIAGIPFSLVALAILAVAGHLFLTRSRLGWHVQAVGGSRRSALNAGIPVRRTVFLSYVISGLCCAVAGFLYAARLTNAGPEVGNGTEIMALTAAVLGGISLGGGRGSVSKVLLGTTVVLLITNSLVAMGLRSGGTSFILGLVLLLAVVIDVRWTKNRQKILARVYISPTYFSLPPCPSTAKDSGSVFAANDALTSAEPIGLNAVDGAEDVIFDSQGHLYTGSRQGDVIRFLAPDYAKSEIFAHIGGHPLGMAIDAQDTINVCVSGMGLYAVDQKREVRKLSDQTNRSLFSIRDDSRIRFADDVDIAPDGRMYFSEATVRFDIYEWASDGLELRGNGRIIAYDPRTDTSRTVLSNLIFPNGICVSHDGRSLLFAETWACRISRYWLEGPQAGKVEIITENLPGYPDNINRASDGNYWIALLGMRTPVLDYSLKMPGFRKRMAQRVAFDEWIYPNLNTGMIVKISDSGEVIQSLWDSTGEKHPMITSMREHAGNLYIGGIFNNRIGRLPLPNADPAWTGPRSYWGGR
ncbi:MAG TPA: SMP-30/gluconolactonase/LRE family protein [Magnetospirillaceae bacterium]